MKCVNCVFKRDDERVWFKEDLKCPKEINFNLQWSYSLALVEVGRSFQYFFWARREECQGWDEWLPGHTIRRATQATLEKCRAVTGWYAEHGQTMAWNDENVNSFAVLYDRFWIWNEPARAVSRRREGREWHARIQEAKKQDSLHQFGWVVESVARRKLQCLRQKSQQAEQKCWWGLHSSVLGDSKPAGNKECAWKQKKQQKKQKTFVRQTHLCMAWNESVIVIKVDNAV